MKVIIFGATGMVGAGVLIECLEDARVSTVTVVGRKPCGVRHRKLKELICSDYFDYSDASDVLRGQDACFFCLGVSAAGMSEEEYRRLTYDLTLAAARALLALNPSLTFCYVSGEGTDSTEHGRFMWARVKGKTENDLLAISPNSYMFRPGYIHPSKGVTSRFRLYRATHLVVAPIFPLVQRLFGSHLTTTVNIGQSMINVASNGYSKRILENPELNAQALTSRAEGRS